MMPSRILLLLLTAGWVALPTSPAVRAAEPALEPNATLQFEFPELGDTLATKASGEAIPAKLTAQLPENYTRDGRFPVFIFLHGGAGGRGDAAGGARGVVGPRDFIAASLPLFKRDLNKQEPYGGLMIAPDDFETISRSYRVMLQKLFDVVPNVDPERSALGGFSNGGHTTAVLLAGQDEFTLRHFRAFYFVDGGFGPLAANVLQKPALQPCRFLLLRGDHPPGAAAREAFVHQARRRVLGERIPPRRLFARHARLRPRAAAGLRDADRLLDAARAAAGSRAQTGPAADPGRSEVARRTRRTKGHEERTKKGQKGQACSFFCEGQQRWGQSLYFPSSCADWPARGPSPSWRSA